jgi:hypothetical protein
MMWGMGLVWLLVVIVLILAAAALIRPRTHKSAGLIDVRFSPNSGAKVDIPGLRLWP